MLLIYSTFPHDANWNTKVLHVNCVLPGYSVRRWRLQPSKRLLLRRCRAVDRSVRPLQYAKRWDNLPSSFLLNVIISKFSLSSFSFLLREIHGTHHRRWGGWLHVTRFFFLKFWLILVDVRSARMIHQRPNTKATHIVLLAEPSVLKV